MRSPSTFFPALIKTLALLGVLTNLAQAQDLEPQVVNPRPFGYVIGDLLERRISVATEQDPSQETLPKAGKVDGWFELRQVVVEKRDDRAELVFTYQLMNSPLEVKTLRLPSLTLAFGEGQVSIPEWPITVSPITPAFVLARDDLTEMRPDLPPQRITTGGAELRIAAYGTAVLGILLWWAYTQFGWRIASRPFGRAYRKLRSLKAKDAGSYQAALRIVHRAFDETAGGALFANELPKFLSKHPRFASAGNDAQKFFSLSQQEFFASNSHAGSFDWLISFCRHLSQLEAK
jgi:mxaA protein